ncbi:diacylglycerol/lipid kinase family protein [Virgibacillus halophilus]|uniref:YegS/Rv2252/BmrU family lipid kinase n=1 Tax=Tigheibacillus halophilus TaxID=361280 RepID=A0ABU5CDU5_9BACI|nr:YegS/Rv2252/BmrU family lipid kinase [Virgibacillus halophilus]
MYAFIVNPAAGHGKGKRVFLRISNSKLYSQLDCRYFYTDAAGDAERIASELCTIKNTNLQVIIVIGGDGTINEVINGIGSKSIPLAFIPGASGNDFARGTRITGSPLEIFEKIVSDTEGGACPYWSGTYSLDLQDERLFVNSIGFGFDAQVVRQANKSAAKKLFNFFRVGKLSYVFALLNVLIHFKPFQVKVVADDKRYIIDRCFMVTVTNHPYYGGGMRIIPNAAIQPDRMSLLLIHSISKWKVLALFLTVFWGGHRNFKEVNIIEASQIEISVSKQNMCQIDGDAVYFSRCSLSKNATPISMIGNSRKAQAVEVIMEKIEGKASVTGKET